jgi:hypothetical protein
VIKIAVAGLTNENCIGWAVNADPEMIAVPWAVIVWVQLE